jgi:1-acyl-sn-glycerol-3-phosphate acyltransferase
VQTVRGDEDLEDGAAAGPAEAAPGTPAVRGGARPDSSSRVGAKLRGAVTLVLLILNTTWWATPLLVLAALKLVTPITAVRERMGRGLIALAESWISTNNAILRLMRALRLELRGDTRLDRREWYLMISNHRSWVDVLALQAAFNRRIPFLKFFIKEQLRWVPLLGLAWWALDMPFMRRHSRAYLQAHPQARGQDLEATRRACAKFRHTPTTVINFVEGTRFTPAKHAAMQSPYAQLLPPRAGGVAFVLGAMGDMLQATLDVTVAYDPRSPSLWDLCCGRVDRIVVHVRRRDIEPWMIAGEYADDPSFRARFQQALADVWAEKDGLLVQLQSELA